MNAAARKFVAEFLTKGPLVVTVYRGVCCQQFNLELKSLEVATSQIEARGAGIVPLSPQTAPNSSMTAAA